VETSHSTIRLIAGSALAAASGLTFYGPSSISFTTLTGALWGVALAGLVIMGLANPPGQRNRASATPLTIKAQLVILSASACMGFLVGLGLAR
jgi:hypothetical protein